MFAVNTKLFSVCFVNVDVCFLISCLESLLNVLPTTGATALGASLNIACKFDMFVCMSHSLAPVFP